MEKIENLTIVEVVEAKNLLVQLIETGNKLEVDLSSLGSIDISGLQLLVSFYKEASILKKDVVLKGEFKQSFRDSLDEFLFVNEPIINGDELTGYIEDIIRSN